MREKIDFSSYSNDELDQVIKDIQNIKINRKMLHLPPPPLYIKVIDNVDIVKSLYKKGLMYNILEFSEISEYNYNYSTKFIKYNYNRSIYYYLDDNKPDTIGMDEYGNRAIISLRPLIIFEE